MKRIMVLVGLFGFLVAPWNAAAQQLRVHVALFAVSGAANQGELKTALQSMLMSRLNGERIITSDTPLGTDITITGTYTGFGKTFSIDAAAKDSSGKTIARTYVQGEEPNELIGAVGKLSKQLALSITTAVAAPSLEQKDDRQNIRGVAVTKPDRMGVTAALSQRIPGVMRGIAFGKTDTNGERQLVIAGEQVLQLYKYGKIMQLDAEIKFPSDEKILAVDSADLDADGTPEIYVTIWNGISLASQVWENSGQQLVKVAEKLPYYFRGIALGGAKKKIYTQQLNSGNDFYGDVYELIKKGNKFNTETPLKLPRFGTLFNFNIFKDQAGATNFVVVSPDGTIVVYDKERKKIWQSSEKYGGSETSFQREDYTNVKVTGESSRSVFLDQRIFVTRAGEIIVPQNVGSWSVGSFSLATGRTFSKSTLTCLAWNGATLKVKWRGDESDNYLADYDIDETHGEAVLLEVVDRSGILEAGASAVSLMPLKKTVF